MFKRKVTFGSRATLTLYQRLASGIVGLAFIFSIFTPAIQHTKADAAYVAQPGVTFNDPNGTDAEEMAIIYKLYDMIDAAPAGSMIRMSFYSISIPDFADRLIAAHQRGVNVKVLMSAHASNAIWESLEKELGTDAASTSYARLCKNSCMTGREGSYMHAKLFMFSTTGSSKKVVMISSANPTYMQARVGFNDAYTIVGDATLYSFYLTYFKDMTSGSLGKRWKSYYRTQISGMHKAYLFPRSGTTTSTDTVYQVLSNISCKGAATGYGYKGRTVVRFAMHGWTKGRIAIAKKLQSLKSAGCVVQVIYSSKIFDSRTGTTVVEPEVKKALKGLSVYDLTIDGDGDGKYGNRETDSYIHNKYITINGVYDGNKKSKIVFNGSHNLTTNGLRYNTEIMMRIKSSGVYQQYSDHYVRMRSIATPEPS